MAESAGTGEGLPPHSDVIVVLDFGSQYAQLIARRVREAGAFSLLQAPDTPVQTLRELNPRGIILSGGPASVTCESTARCDPALLELGVPVLGICYGMQLGCQLLKCEVRQTPKAEYGTLQTTPLRLTQAQLIVNANAERGELRVAVRGPDGDPLPGHAMKDFDVLTTDGTALVASWRGSADLVDLAGQEVSLAFELRGGVELYGYRWQSPAPND